MRRGRFCALEILLLAAGPDGQLILQYTFEYPPWMECPPSEAKLKQEFVDGERYSG